MQSIRASSPKHVADDAGRAVRGAVTEFETLTLLRLEPGGDVTGRRRVAVFRAAPAVADKYAAARTDASLRIWSSLTKVPTRMGDSDRVTRVMTRISDSVGEGDADGRPQWVTRMR